MDNFKQRSVKSLIMVSVLVLILAACSPGAGGGKTLRVALEKTLTTLNYQAMTSRDEMEQVSQIMEGLTRYNREHVLSPAGAESWEVSEDDLTYTFKIRPNMVWSNGEPVTANDYVFAWKNLAIDKKTNSAFFINLLQNGKAVREGSADPSTLGVSAPDQETLVVKLVNPYPAFLDAVSTVTYYPLNEKAYTSIGAENYGTSMETIVTNGAFALRDYQPASIIELKKNEKYWDAENVKIDKVLINIIPELTTQAVMFDNGELDILRVTNELVEKYQDNENTITAVEPRIVYMYLSGDTQPNMLLLKNANFRQAIARAIDKNVLVENILRDGSQPLNSLIPNDFGNVNGQTFRNYAGTHNASTYDVTAAQTYLTDAKAELGPEVPLHLKISVQNTVVYRKIFENIKSQLETNLPGVSVELDMIPNQVYFPQLMKRETPAGVASWSAAYMDYYNFAELFISDDAFNYANYQNPNYDGFVNQALITGNVEEQAKLYISAENAVIHDGVYVPLYQVGVKYRIQPNVKGMVLNQSAPSLDYKFMVID